jgi:hypothetical protein
MWSRGRFNQEYLPGLFQLAIDSYESKRAQSMWKDLVTVKTSAKAKEEDVIRSGLSTLRPKGEGASITYDTQIAGPKKTWVHQVQALGVRITEEAIDDNLYELKGGGEGSLKELFHDLGESAEETIETEIAKFFNFGAATTFHTTRFAQALFSTAHPRLDGSTFSNRATSADLTYSTFWAAVVAAENNFNHRGHKTVRKINKLWVPPQYEQKALEIIKSTDRPDTANRATNAYAKSGRSIQLMVWPQMTDVDSWILQKEGRGIIFFWRRKTRFARDRDFQTGDVMVKVDQRWSAEVADEESFYGVIP